MPACGGLSSQCYLLPPPGPSTPIEAESAPAAPEEAEGETVARSPIEAIFLNIFLKLDISGILYQ